MSTQVDESQAALTNVSGKYLTFQLSEVEYGLEIHKVREIIGMMKITPLPKLPHYVKGVLNLRGKVIPVIDLRLCFGLSGIEQTERTCIIVIEIQADDDKMQIGLVVDAVSEVLNVNSEDVEEAPKINMSVNTEYILGMAKTQGKVRTLLDINKVLATDEIRMAARKVA